MAQDRARFEVATGVRTVGIKEASAILADLANQSTALVRHRMCLQEWEVVADDALWELGGVATVAAQNRPGGLVGAAGTTCLTIVWLWCLGRFAGGFWQWIISVIFHGCFRSGLLDLSFGRIVTARGRQ